MTNKKIGKLWKKTGVPFIPSQHSQGRHEAIPIRELHQQTQWFSDLRRCVKCSDGGKVVVAGHRVECDNWKWNFYEFLH